MGDEDCHVSWEKEELIPKDVLEEYKSDNLVQVQQLSTEGIGQTSHTLCVRSTEKDQVPENKKQKCDRIVVQPDNGYDQYMYYMYVPYTQISGSYMICKLSNKCNKRHAYIIRKPGCIL